LKIDSDDERQSDSPHNETQNDQTDKILNALSLDRTLDDDIHFFRYKFVSTIPESYTVVTIALSNDKHSLLLSRLRRNGQEGMVLRLPIKSIASKSGKHSATYSPGNSETISQPVLMSEFDTILCESKLCNSSAAKLKQCASRTEKLNWWNKRHSLDGRLQQWLTDIENQWFGAWKGVLLGKFINDQFELSLTKAAERIVSTLSECLVKKSSRLHLIAYVKIILSSYQNLSKGELLQSAKWLFDQQMSSTNRHENIETFVNEITNTAAQLYFDNSVRSRFPVVLMLCGSLQHLPFESMPLLRNSPVTRMPNWIALHMHWLKYQEQLNDFDVIYRNSTDNCYYVLNPDGDLNSTHQIFEKYFTKKCNWTGVIQQKPTINDFKFGLCFHSFFIYCGHGNGGQYVSHRNICQFNKINSISFLMGCSSALLNSERNSLYDINGMIHSYILAECPNVIGNLFDVTETDCDRFTVELLNQIFSNKKLKQNHTIISKQYQTVPLKENKTILSKENKTILDYIQISRNVCKLKYLIGAAPIVYGLPISILQN